MNHPIPKGTKVVVEYTSCQTCGPNRIQKIVTRIREVIEVENEYSYILLDGREVNSSQIIEVKS